jgi:two-component system chemotaxis response regulator CheB
MQPLKTIRVFVIDSSPAYYQLLYKELPKQSSMLQVIGCSSTMTDALQSIYHLNPDVVTLNVQMPTLDALTFLRELLPVYPVPIILVSTAQTKVFDALAIGALDFLHKPDLRNAELVQPFLLKLAKKIIIASHAKVKVAPYYATWQFKSEQMQQKPSTNTQAEPTSAVCENTAPTPPSPPMERVAKNPLPTTTKSGKKERKLQGKPKTAPPKNKNVQIVVPVPPTVCPYTTQVIAIGASTGGTEATLQVLQELPKNIPPIVVTQHMPPDFTRLYAERINHLCRINAREACDGDLLEPGLALIAPGGDRHMKIVRIGTQYRVRLVNSQKVNGHCPSVDVLFDSVANTAHEHAVGILLTGMGQDGAKGILHMRQQGAYTIGQDESSCVVYGMPKVANELGGICTEVPCNAIPRVLLHHLQAENENSP